MNIIMYFVIESRRIGETTHVSTKMVVFVCTGGGEVGWLSKVRFHH